MKKYLLPMGMLAISALMPIQSLAFANRSESNAGNEVINKSKQSKDIHSADIEKKVKKIICKSLCVEEKDVMLKSNIVKDLGADSLDTVEIIMEIEKEFGIAIPDDDADGIITVKDAVDYVKEVLNVKK